MQLLSILTFVASATAATIPSTKLGERQTCANANADALAQAKAAFTAAEIVSEVIPQFDPTLELSVSYGSKAVEFGNTFNTLETIPEPTFSITSEEGFDPATTKYTLIKVDPDAPGPGLPILADFLHWIVSDVQPECIADQQRDQVAPYMLPTPLSVSPHRYTFLIYRQPMNYVPPPSLNYVPGVRAKFDLASYVEQAKLIGPVGGNYYREGLEQDVCLLTPGCTQDGVGYVESNSTAAA